jgi:hypothetical protein
MPSQAMQDLIDAFRGGRAGHPEPGRLTIAMASPVSAATGGARYFG